MYYFECEYCARRRPWHPDYDTRMEDTCTKCGEEICKECRDFDPYVNQYDPLCQACYSSVALDNEEWDD